jgi:hypothetical protein
MEDKKRISTKEFYDKITQGANDLFEIISEAPSIDLKNANNARKMRLKTELRKWLHEELQYEYDLEKCTGKHGC